METGFHSESQIGQTYVTVNIGSTSFVVAVMKRSIVQQGKCVHKAINRAYELDFNSDVGTRVDKEQLSIGKQLVHSTDNPHQQDDKACSHSADNFNNISGKKKSIRTDEIYRIPYMKWQINILKNEFKIWPHLVPERKLEIARMTDLGPRQVEVWFQNKRRKLKSYTGQ